MQREEDEPVFHDRWEAIAIYTIANHMMRQGVIRNVDQFRHGIERIDPVAYLTHGYYGRWLGGVENLLTEAGVLEAEQMAAAVEARGGSRDDLVAARPRETSGSGSASRTAPGAGRDRWPDAPRFSVGELVRTAATSVSGHTRLPGLRARSGRHHRPSARAAGCIRTPMPMAGASSRSICIACASKAAELWGEEAEPGQSVCLDLFESYLERR